MNDIREAIKKVWEHEKRLEGFDMDVIKKMQRDIEMLKDWFSKLEEMLASSGKGSSTVTDAQFS